MTPDDGAPLHETATHPDAARADRPAHTRQSRWLVIRNPVAGGDGRPGAWRRHERALRREGIRFDVATTSGPDDAARLAGDARRAGIGGLLVAGGDGTAHEAVNGLLETSCVRTASMPCPTVVPMPLGTGNDWARTLGVPRHPERFARFVAHSSPVAHDAGVLHFPARNAATPARRAWFVNVAGTGFDAHVIARLPRPTPSRLAYLITALRELGRYETSLFKLRAENDGVVSQVVGRLLLAFFAIGRYCGHGMQVAPLARIDDGALDLVTVADANRWVVLSKLHKLYGERLLGDALVGHRRVTRIVVEAEPCAPVQADGQTVGSTPVECELRPAALRVLRRT